MKSFTSPPAIFVIAPLCDHKTSKWFSSGRHRKLSQLFHLFGLVNYKFNLFSTAPFSSTTYLGHSFSRCCSLDAFYLRYIELFFSGVYIGFKLLFKKREIIYLWLYNSRASEFIFILPIKLLNYRNTR